MPIDMAYSHLGRIYRPGFGMLTDLYQLTMGAGYYRQRMHERRVVFSLYYRRPPFEGRFALAAGLPLAMDIIEGLRFSADDVQYLGRLKGADGKPLFREPYLNYLQRMKFTGRVDAVPEGEIALPDEPLLRVEAPLIQAQLLETALLTVVNFSTLIATKAARVKAAAGDDPLLEFGLRRAQGIDGGLTASRSAYLGGCDGSSNVWAGQYYGIPVRGTHAHSWVMVFPDETTAFEAYAEAMPGNAVFLVDTYDTLEGVRRAIRVAEGMRERGHEMVGIRLDSGDLVDLSRRARRLLDAAGFPGASIVASDSLDEYAITRLKAAGARINVWGVGTRLSTAYDQPALGGVYKLTAVEGKSGWEGRMKQSDNPVKRSYPGILTVNRYYQDGRPTGSQLHDTLLGEAPPAVVLPDGSHQALGGERRDLLVPVFREGQTVYAPPPLDEVRERALNSWRSWTATAEEDFHSGPSPALWEARRAGRKPDIEPPN